MGQEMSPRDGIHSAIFSVIHFCMMCQVSLFRLPPKPTELVLPRETKVSITKLTGTTTLDDNSKDLVPDHCHPFVVILLQLTAHSK